LSSGGRMRMVGISTTSAPSCSSWADMSDDCDRARVTTMALPSSGRFSNHISFSRSAMACPTIATAGGAMPAPPGMGAQPEPPREGNFRPRFGRPRWMSEQDYQTLLQQRGVHSFVIVMSTQPIHVICDQDFWLRAIIALLATISVVGSGLAWRNLSKTSDLQIRLVRASEMNSHLREMNLAAAGLAHETRNPLNIIRGLAQMISKQTGAPPEIREKSRAILDETDKVTAQLNEFINYSRPREVRQTADETGTAASKVLGAARELAQLSGGLGNDTQSA